MKTQKQYKSLLSRPETERAIDMVKTTFATCLASKLNLSKVSAPIAVIDGTGINDDLNGTERPVAFPIKAMGEQKAVIVHSLAKWKRLRLYQLGIPAGSGLYTDMRALRPDEDFSPIHSIYVDQWDWEKHITGENRKIPFLKDVVEKIYGALKDSEKEIYKEFPEIVPVLPERITFIHTEDLLKKYPALTVKEREREAAREYKAIFVIGIGGDLGNGTIHDGRAPDYDDWSTPTEKGYHGLNGDIILWNPVLESAFEISSMGIRVDKAALLKQLEIRHANSRKDLAFHKMLLTGVLPQSIGGGIGQSRVVMFMLRKLHIGEVQASIWPESINQACTAMGVELL